jgi:aminobenzoyl-glutamate utilization protein B
MRPSVHSPQKRDTVYLFSKRSKGRQFLSAFSEKRKATPLPKEKITMTKQELFTLLEENKQQFFDASDAIWDMPELSLSEHTAAGIYVKMLAQLGFEVQENVAGMKTAFTGSYGSGKPVIGILGEYDALAYLSQKAGALEPCPITEGGSGHGCGHNLLGMGSLAAAWAVKNYLEAKGPGSGTVIFYGCPGEEGGAGKAFMAKTGL